eukprot:XP_763660.1 Fe-superoxide dismutase [Theileria parva strain Muguga]
MNEFFLFLIPVFTHCYIINSPFNRLYKYKVLKSLFNDGKGLVNDLKRFELMELPYVRKQVVHIFQKLDELSPDLSEEAVRFHYLKHHQGYVNNLNKLIRSAEGKVYENACQIWNHNQYWLGLDPHSAGKPTKFVEDVINLTFQTYDNFKQQFVEAAANHFGSGWVWLLYFKNEPNLRIVDTHDGDNPIKLYNNGKPLLTLDIWEHAYYIDYRNDRRGYTNSWFNKVNWNRVEKSLKEQMNI